MPVYERLDGRLDVVDTRPVEQGHDAPQRPPVTSVKEAIARGSLDDVAEATVRALLSGPLPQAGRRGPATPVPLRGSGS